MLDTVATRSEPVYLVGDLNIRLDRADDANAVSLTDLLSTMQLGGMLDVVVTRQDLTTPDVKVVDVGLSDHGLLQWSVSSNHPVPAVETFV